MKVMKVLFFSIIFLGVCMPVYSSDTQLEEYIASFDYAARKEMKMDSKDLLVLLKQGKAQLIDIRFLSLIFVLFWQKNCADYS